MITASILLTALALPQAAPAKGKPEAKPQDVLPAKPTLKQLASAVAKAHRPGAKAGKAAIDRYAADITIQVKDEEKAGFVDIQLKVKYGEAIEVIPGRTTAMVRYETNEGGKPLTRGFDRRGPWMRIGKELRNLNTKDNQTDGDILRSHMRLCKVMLRFLDPGKIISGLQGATAAHDVPLQVGRGKKNRVECHLVSGMVGGFPVADGAGKKVRNRMVWMEAWVDKKTAQIRAIRVRPWTGKGKTKVNTGEDIVFEGFQLVDGILMPKALKFYDMKSDKRSKKWKVKIQLDRVQMNLKLTRDDFSRDK